MSKTIFLTAFALVAFAFNSILCRLALRGDEADAAGFTVIRLISGALTLVAISLFSRGAYLGALRNSLLKPQGSWGSALWLAVYAICFSLAYLSLTVATGALILFGTVQLTIILISAARGERPGIVELCGLSVALSGLIYLAYPGLAAPSLTSSLLMAAAGVAWGLYTLRGKASRDPIADTAGNFVRTVPFAILIAAVYLQQLHVSARGAALSVLSGAVASAIGYAAWYAVLKVHTPTRIAVLQLSVPVLVGFAGVVFMSESFTARLAVSAGLIIGGIGITIVGRRR